MFHQYNTFRYNTTQYNTDAFYWVQACAETISSADTMGPSPAKVATETITLTETFVKAGQKPLSEALLVTDAVTKSISNKGLSESVRMNDWVQIDRQKEDNHWSS